VSRIVHRQTIKCGAHSVIPPLRSTSFWLALFHLRTGLFYFSLWD
jgi:hypothetical protein